MILNLVLPFSLLFMFLISLLYLSPLPSSFHFFYILYFYFFLFCSFFGSLSSLFICQSIFLSVYMYICIYIYIHIQYVHTIVIGVRHIGAELSTYDYLFLMYSNHPLSSLDPSALQPPFFLYFNSCVL